ncbi:hypothetical protein ABBQ38_003705 [Trebouxia sp. C0009 RCD-2024]
MLLQHRTAEMQLECRCCFERRQHCGTVLPCTLRTALTLPSLHSSSITVAAMVGMARTRGRQTDHLGTDCRVKMHDSKTGEISLTSDQWQLAVHTHQWGPAAAATLVPQEARHGLNVSRCSIDTCSTFR